MQILCSEKQKERLASFFSMMSVNEMKLVTKYVATNILFKMCWQQQKLSIRNVISNLKITAKYMFGDQKMESW